VTRLDDMVANARLHAAANRVAGLTAAPALHIAFVACMDSRIDVFTMFGLSTGDAHVLRNAGGLMTDDMVRSLTLSQRMLGTRAIVIVQHTGCGLLGVDDDEFAARLEQQTGSRPSWRAGGFDDVEENVRRSMRAAKDSPFIPYSDELYGFVYDLDSARLLEVQLS
jgi:carbonic anhydrase